jgi:hypothetical protein
MRFGWFKQGRLALVVGAGLFSFGATLLLPDLVFATPISKKGLVVNYDGTIDTAFPAGDKAQGGNQAPVWNSPTILTCTEDTASSIDLNPTYVSDADGDTLAITSQGTALPTGVTIDDTNDELDCAGTTVGGWIRSKSTIK